MCTMLDKSMQTSSPHLLFTFYISTQTIVSLELLIIYSSNTYVCLVLKVWKVDLTRTKVESFQVYCTKPPWQRKTFPHNEEVSLYTTMMNTISSKILTNIHQTSVAFLVMLD